MTSDQSIKPFIFYTDKVNFKSEDTAKGKNYWVEGYISTHDMDLVNDIVTKSCMDSMLNQFDGRSIKLDFEHETFRGNDPISKEAAKTRMPLGKAVEKTIDRKGISVKWQMNPTWKKFDEKGNVVMSFKDVWQNIEDGYFDAFSIAYVPTRTQSIEREGKSIRMLDDVNLLNVALTGNPINPAAKMGAVMAKSLEFMKSQETEEINMSEVEIKGALDRLDEAVDELKSKIELEGGAIYARFSDKRDSGTFETTELIKKGTEKDSSKEKDSPTDFSAYGTSELISYIAENSDKSESDLSAYGERELIAEAEKIETEKNKKKYKEATGKDPDKIPKAGDKMDIADKEKIKEMREIAEEVDTSDLQGIATVEATKLLGIKLSEAREDKKKQQALSEAENTLLDYAYGDIDLDKAEQQITTLRTKISEKSQSSSNADKKHMGCKNMTEEENKQPDAPNPEPQKEAGQEAEGQETGNAEAGAEAEQKSMTLKELKSSVLNMQEQIKSLEKENKDLKAVVEKAQFKSKGAETKENKSQGQPVMNGPLDMI